MLQNPFPNTLDNKRYYTFNAYLKNTYHSKVAKVSLDAYFSCPNRDGTKSTVGCIYCSNRGSGDFTFSGHDLETQYNTNLEVMRRKWPTCDTIPYFQAFTNTYGPLTKIKAMLEPFLLKKEVRAIALATRPDCLNDDVLDYLASLTSIKDIWLELGLQSSNDQTTSFLNRHHDFACLTTCLKRLENTSIKVCLHIINGLPNETEDDMLQTINDIKDLHFHALKIHMLHIIEDTPLYDYYRKNPFKMLSKEAYIDIVIKQLELLPQHIIIERITGDPVREHLIAPEWLLNKTSLINDIDKTMVQRATYQGKLYNSK